jgi:hypothetical protein
MYNGIGLTTVRGSATSGHVTKNLSYVKPEFFRRKVDTNANVGQYQQHHQQQRSYAHDKEKMGPPRQSADKEILEHNRKRELEAKIFEIRETMMEQGFSEEEIQDRVDKLARNHQTAAGKSGGGFSTDSHELASRKYEENARLARAFGVDTDGN